MLKLLNDYNYFQLLYCFLRLLNISKIVKIHLDVEGLVKTNEDYKSQLQIFCQKNKFTLEYRLISENRVDANKHYIVQVFIDGKPFTRFENYSKRMAEQKAAQLTLEELKNEIG